MVATHSGGGPIIVTGASGAGKSSLLHAGLLPQLSTMAPDSLAAPTAQRLAADHLNPRPAAVAAAGGTARGPLQRRSRPGAGRVTRRPGRGGGPACPADPGRRADPPPSGRGDAREGVCEGGAGPTATDRGRRPVRRTVHPGLISPGRQTGSRRGSWCSRSAAISSTAARPTRSWPARWRRRRSCWARLRAWGSGGIHRGVGGSQPSEVLGLSASLLRHLGILAERKFGIGRLQPPRATGSGLGRLLRRTREHSGSAAGHPGPPGRRSLRGCRSGCTARPLTAARRPADPPRPANQVEDPLGPVADLRAGHGA